MNNMTTHELMNLTVKSIMTTDVHTAYENTIMVDVNEIFNSHHLHHLPIINNHGDFVGLISQQDIDLLKNWGTRLGLEQADKKNTFQFKTRVAKEVMNKNIVYVAPSDTLEHCADILRKNTFHAMPVLDNGKLVGIITTYDMLNVAFQSASQ